MGGGWWVVVGGGWWVVGGGWWVVGGGVVGGGGGGGGRFNILLAILSSNPSCTRFLQHIQPSLTRSANPLVLLERHIVRSNHHHQAPPPPPAHIGLVWKTPLG